MTNTRNFIFVLTKAGQELMVQFDETFTELCFIDDNETVVMSTSNIDEWVAAPDYAVARLSQTFDPGTIQTIREFAGF